MTPPAMAPVPAANPSMLSRRFNALVTATNQRSEIRTSKTYMPVIQIPIPLATRTPAPTS